MKSSGVVELYRPGDGIADIDIVAVQGVQGDALQTWTSKPPNQTCWLSDTEYLPRYIPNARVLSWGYNADILSSKNSVASEDRILQHAQTLVAQLCSDREYEEAVERPIIFLCHSLGGIVVKRALTYSASRTAAKISHLHSVYTCTYGLMFFGTPHHGCSQAKLSAVIRNLVPINIASRHASATRSRLITSVEEDSETLQDINDQFCPLMSRFRIFFFWEQEKTSLKSSVKREYIVPETSAAPILDNTERCGIAADHLNMCRFRSPKSQGFRDVMSALKRYCQDAPEVVAARVQRSKLVLQQKRNDEAMELIRSLQGPRNGALHVHESHQQFDMGSTAYGLAPGQPCGTGSGHNYPQFTISGNARVQMGDRYVGLSEQTE